MKFSEALKKLREKNIKRKFDQTLDLIINLKDFDVKRESANAVLTLPFTCKKKKIAAFLESREFGAKADFVISKADVDRLKDKEIKKIAKNYDFFIANAKMMPLIAKKFGKTLGSVGKMPDPKLGAVLLQENEDAITTAVQKLEKITRIKTKEASIKIAIGKESMKDEDLEKNASVTLETIIPALPRKEHNIRNILLKFTMSTPIKVEK